MSRDIGRAEEAIDRAEDAAFHAANVLQSHVDPDPDRDVLLTELVDIANRLRAVTGSSQMYVEDGSFAFGHRWLSKGGRAFKRLVVRR